ncbi:MAG TPA: hypothetical protein PLD73_04070 [Candidatus Hydrogenedentes bacterium]|nr:hypothetical protein [Candidatus Hydrogenedentota bacterium]
MVRKFTAWALLLGFFLSAGCGERGAPVIPPGMVPVGEHPLEINTPPLKVVARITEPFPEETASAADELDAALRDMGLDLDQPVESPEPAISGDTKPAGADGEEDATEELSEAPDGASEVGIADELAALRSDVARMQAMLDLVLDEFVISLKNENNRLREELETLEHALETREAMERAPFPPLSLPDAAQARGTPAVAERPPAYDAVAMPAPGESIRYAVIKEWGRNAEEAARLNNASTLKGMICAVPPQASDDQLAELGRWLRSEYDAYENINIDVFDDVDAARRFAETNSMEGGRRVLNVSRHPATNRDVIVLIRPDGTTVIPRETAP